MERGIAAHGGTDRLNERPKLPRSGEVESRLRFTQNLMHLAPLALWWISGTTAGGVSFKRRSLRVPKCASACRTGCYAVIGRCMARPGAAPVLWQGIRTKTPVEALCILATSATHRDRDLRRPRLNSTRRVRIRNVGFTNSDASSQRKLFSSFSVGCSADAAKIL